MSKNCYIILVVLFDIVGI